MANHGRTPSGTLEDEIRRMILSDNSAHSNGLYDANGPPQSRPAVRLPPGNSYAPHQRNSGQQQQQQQQHAQIPRQTFGAPNGSAAQQTYQQQPSTHGRGAPLGQYGGNYWTYPPQQQQQRSHQGGGPKQSGLNVAGPQTQGSAGPQQSTRHQRQMQLDPNAFQRRGFGGPPAGRGQNLQQLFNPHDPRAAMPPSWEQQHAQQGQYLEAVAAAEIAKVEMSAAEHQEKEQFRLALQQLCHEVCAESSDRLPQISLEPFGSFKSGFATAGSDMDLVIVVRDHSSESAVFSLLQEDLPRVLEKRLLERGLGARLLTRTRVPIIKVCEKPDAELLGKLREERQKWDELPEKEKYPHLFEAANGEAIPAEQEGPIGDDPITHADGTIAKHLASSDGAAAAHGVGYGPQEVTDTQPDELAAMAAKKLSVDHNSANFPENNGAHAVPAAATEMNARVRQRREDKAWTREKKAGPLDFPKHGIGIQTDINFFNPLGLHNTQLLHCYSLCDPRVRPMVIFVKAWAKRRKINSSYSGTLSSYGYVLMVLHYLVNVARPPVLPNLQTYHQLEPYGPMRKVEVGEWDVSFWRNENEIMQVASQGGLTRNREPLGSLLAGFFHYYAAQGGTRSSFHWMQQVLSLRTPGGIVTKEEKGWVKAKTEEGDGKRVQHRYLFAIEDPFELDHNVARTVTHHGIVAIRNEFRRAHAILVAVGHGQVPKEGELFAELVEEEQEEVKQTASGDRRQNGAANGRTDQQQSQRTGQPAGQNMQQPSPTIAQHPNLSRAQRTASRNKPQTGPHQQLRLQQKSLDLTDKEAFPTLGARANSGKKKAGLQMRDGNGEFSEISGDQARAYLEEVKRKRAEQQAESVARFAAESVLEGDD